MSAKMPKAPDPDKKEEKRAKEFLTKAKPDTWKKTAGEKVKEAIEQRGGFERKMVSVSLSPTKAISKNVNIPDMRGSRIGRTLAAKRKPLGTDSDREQLAALFILLESKEASISDIRGRATQLCSEGPCSVKDPSFRELAEAIYEYTCYLKELEAHNTDLGFSVSPDNPLGLEEPCAKAKAMAGGGRLGLNVLAHHAKEASSTKHRVQNTMSIFYEIGLTKIMATPELFAVYEDNAKTPMLQAKFVLMVAREATPEAVRKALLSEDDRAFVRGESDCHFMAPSGCQMASDQFKDFILNRASAPVVDRIAIPEGVEINPYPDDHTAFQALGLSTDAPTEDHVHEAQALDP